jgi:glycosyltransferase involved in cell wall biosynthesis
VAVRLDVVGDNRTHPRRDFAALVERLGLREAVNLIGYVTEQDLAERYAAADVAVVLSEYEGFGLPALEAAARGLPLVVADRPALSEVAGPAALCVDPRDPAAIASAVERVLGDPDLRRDLVARGHALVGRYTWRETARLTRDALAGAAGDGASA